jgi:hypothetical protein
MNAFKFQWGVCFIAASLLLLAPEVICAQDAHFLPAPDYNPIKVRINLIVLQRADGSGNFQDNAADRTFIQNMVNVTNGVFADLTNRNEEYYPGKNLPFLSNAKVQFVPEILFVRDEKGWNNRNDTNFAGVPYLSGWYLDTLDQLIYGSDTLAKAINLYFTTDGQLYEEMVVKGSTTDYDHRVFFKQHAASEIPVVNSGIHHYGKLHSMRCHVGNVWLKLWWKRKILLEPDWSMEYEVGESIAHELGHLMGLGHTPDHHKDALMRTRFGGLRDYLTTREITTMHQVFGGYPSFYQCIPDSIVYGSSGADWVITGNETWTQDRRIFANVILKAGASLTITSEILMPPQGTIFLEPGASLWISEGTVRRVHTPLPETIQGESEQKSVFSSPYLWVGDNWEHAGILHFSGNGRIEESVLRVVRN